MPADKYIPRILSRKPGSEPRLLPGKLDNSRLPDDVNFDFSGIFEVLFYLESDISRHIFGFDVRNLVRFDENAYFSARLESVSLLDALKSGRDGFQITQTLDVVLDRVSSSARTAARNDVGDLNNDGFWRFERIFLVMSLHCLDNGFVGAEFLENAAADFDVRALDFVV